MNLQPFDMPGDPVVAGIVTCVFWQVLTMAVYGTIQAWLTHHIAKTPAGRVGVAVVGLLLAVPLAILQTCIAIPLLHMYQDGAQSLFLVGMLVLDGGLAVAVVLRKKDPPRPPDPSCPSGNPPASASQAPTVQAPQTHTSRRFPFLNRRHTAGDRGGTP